MPTTVFTQTLNLEDPNHDASSHRIPCTVTSGSLGQVRVTFGHAAAGTLSTNNCSIAIVGSATAPNTQFTPTELLFSGSSGFSGLAYPSTITSDWLTFSFLSTDTVMVIFDVSGVNNGGLYSLGYNSSATSYESLNTASYNLATVSNFSLNSGASFTVTMIETQAAGPPPALYPTIWM